MAGLYRGLFGMPGAKGFVVAGFVGRMPMSMLGIGVVLLIQTLTGSYAMAGAVAATVSLSYAVAAPLTGRLVDRFGQARVIVPFGLGHGAALTGLMFCAGSAVPRWALFATGVATGATAMSLGSLVRARWSYLLAGTDRLHAAFSFESVADEVVFVTGPALVTALATMVNPYAGLAVALTCMIVGTLALAAQRGTEPPVRPATAGAGTPIAIPGVALMSAAFCAMGAVFGSVDLITVAFADERGIKPAAGLLLAAVAAGSMLSGLWYGARRWRITLNSRFARSLAVFAVGMIPLSLVGDPRLMAVALFVAGTAISPTVITGYSLVERLVPPALLTEGMSWLSTSIGLGVALGAWAGGRLTDAFGASNAYVFPLGCALLAAAIGAAGAAWLRTPVARPES
ncbi:MFS transporter [Streptosporangium sp. NPDC048047]|uniref:MFS transporter n=1 Tax=Streptosporangium sp. NPDC048047 TaxID=3155748 RepID=UPI00344A78A6